MALEQLFASFKDSGSSPGGSAGFDPSDPDVYQDYIKAMIKDSRDYEGSVLAPARDNAQKYYYGLKPTLYENDAHDTYGPVQPDTTYEELLGHEREKANKSSFVSTDVRDAVLLMMPALIRLFASSENVVSLIPRTPADVDAAQQQTKYINYVFWQDNPGFLLLHGAFKDALTVKAGFVKWWTDDRQEVRRKTFVNLNPQQIQLLQQQDQTAKLLSLGQVDPLMGTYDEAVFEYQVDKPLIKIAGVPPEEMRVDRYARSWATSRICGHERIVPVDELVAMGYERELCMEHQQGQMLAEFTMEAQLRNPGRYMSTRVGDGVLYGEWYIKADKDGDGRAELRYVCTMGEDHDIVHDKEANRIKFACFSVDPISHTIIGDSIADLTMDIQRIKTFMMRGVLDSLAESINPRTVVNELAISSMDEVLSDDIGAVIRTRGDPSAAVAFSTTPFAGQAAMPVVDLLNDILSRRTGLTDTSRGLDPKALQSSTAVGVEAIINGAQERIELIARILAETGFKDLFAGLYNEIAEAPNQRRTLRINGQWTDIDTGSFDASMGVEVNSTLGKGSDTVRMMTLNQIKADQQLIMQTYGLGNPVVGVTQFLNTISDMLELANIKNVSRYFMTPDPAVLQQIAQTPKEPDAMSISAKAQYEKVKMDAAQNLVENQIRMRHLALDDDLQRQKLQSKDAYEMQKLDIERQKQGITHLSNAADFAQNVFKTSMEAETDRHVASIQANAQQANQPPGPPPGGNGGGPSPQPSPPGGSPSGNGGPPPDQGSGS